MTFPKDTLREFWESLHEKYGAAIRFGLSDADQQRLLALEKQCDQAEQPQPSILAPGNISNREILERYAVRLRKARSKPGLAPNDHVATRRGQETRIGEKERFDSQSKRF